MVEANGLRQARIMFEPTTCCDFLFQVLLSSRHSAGLKSANSFGVVEHCFELCPLKLYNSLRLFARLTSIFQTAKQRYTFIRSMIPPMPKGGFLNAGDVDLLPVSAKILKIIGEGHPDKIIKMAFECDDDGIKKLQSAASRILEDEIHESKIHSHGIKTFRHDHAASQHSLQGRSTEVDTEVRFHSDFEQRTSMSSLPAIPLSVGESAAFSNTSVFGNTVFAPASAKPDGLINPFEYYENDVTQSLTYLESRHVGATVQGSTSSSNNVLSSVAAAKK
jgi:hypothetical protein